MTTTKTRGEHLPPISRCKSCGAEIVWVKTRKDKAMPLDATPEKRAVIVGHDLFGQAIIEIKSAYLPHWASCPHADQHRRGQS